MSLPDWLQDDYVPVYPPDPEVTKAIKKYEDHFGKFDIDMIHLFSREKIISIVDYCIKLDKCYQDLYPKDPSVLAY